MFKMLVQLVAGVVLACALLLALAAAAWGCSHRAHGVQAKPPVPRMAPRQ